MLKNKANATAALTVLCAVLVGFVMFPCRADAQSLEYVETVDQERELILQFLKRNLVSVEYRDGSARFVSNGRLGQWEDRAWVTDFELEEGEKFLQQPDDHGSVQFKVRYITRQGVDIEYTSMFDHRSFGPNKVTIDRGTVFLRYKIRKIDSTQKPESRF